jgi:succinate-semialdehyde dehydrogenase/glutarate-semialdehyde dehydrogenase
MSAFERSKIMRRADLLRERADEIARLMTRNRASRYRSQDGNPGCADTIDWFAEEARRTYGRLVPARTRVPTRW